MLRVTALVIALMLLPSCSSLRPNGPRVTLPAIAGWYDGMRVYYVTTEITDPTMARNAGVTYAPRLEDAVPEYPKPPELRTVLERVYKFPGNMSRTLCLPRHRPRLARRAPIRPTVPCGLLTW